MARFRTHQSTNTPINCRKFLWLFIVAVSVFFSLSPMMAQVTPPFNTFPDSIKSDTTRQSIFPLPDDDIGTDTTLHLRKTKYRTPADSLNALADSINTITDSLSQERRKERWQDFTDSTARVEQFVHQRYDAPMVDMFPNENYTLYLDPSQQVYKREIEIDTLGETITVREQVNGIDVKVPTTMKLDDYLHLRYEYEKKRSWRSIATQYTTSQKKDDLSNLLGSITNISITVPANPISNIFGGTENNLRISGGVDIRAAFRNTTSDQQTISKLDKSRNEPDFNQNVQVNVSGTIGKKLNILADWNTQRTFEYENQLKIKYTGFDDEIIQSIEAGNVSLQTPSLVGGGQALFGIKAKLQMGPLTLTTLLSQKKGQTKELTITGGSTSNEKIINAYDYSKNHFFIDTLYAKFFESLFQAQSRTLTPDIEENQIIQIDVYETNVANANQLYNSGRAFKGRAYINLPELDNEQYTPDQIALLSTDPAGFEEGIFVQLDPTKDYKYDKDAGFITMTQIPNENQMIAVQYTIVGSNNINKVFGGKVIGDSLRYLKLVKPSYLKPSYKQAWSMMLKNFYNIQAPQTRKEGFKLRIIRNATQGADDEYINNENLVTALGLDRFDQSFAPKPDNVFDFLPGLTIDVDRGEVIFPTLRPFDSAMVRYFRSKNKPIGDSLLFSAIYDTTYIAAQKDPNAKYVIKVVAPGSPQSSFSLGGMNLVEGSVRVLLNGSPLTPNVDYTVDYIIGQVVIRKPEALVPGANLQIKYEQNDLFQLASKSLIGARGELDAFPNTKLGFTVMNLNQQTLSDKVRIGEEPTNNTMFGADFSTSSDLPFLTRLIDAMPFIQTKEMSNWRFGGEGAYMKPDPNTKKSTVVGDHGASIAYIDDFEGIRKTIPLPITYAAWTLASAPVEIDSLLKKAVPESLMNFRKARLSWYNRLPTDVTTIDIWPNRKTRAGQNQVTVLNLDYNPNHRGTYNFSSNLDSTLHRTNIGGTTGKFDNPEERRKNWAGVMRYIGTMGGDILGQNIAYIEVWMKASSANQNDLTRGRLIVDLGRMSEDVIANRQLNSEDIIRTAANPEGIPNGILNEGEDVGLDMLSDDQERIEHSLFLSSNAGDPDIDPNDPAGDNWTAYGDGVHLAKFNGTDKNREDPAGLLPNTEDLNGNGSVDLADQYAEYEIPFLDSSYIVGGGENGWYQYRIPLLKATRTIGGAQALDILQNVQYVRMWLSGLSDSTSIRIAEFDLVGNQWEERTKNDSLMKVSVINIEDNPEYSKDWNELGIAREKDRSDPNQIIEANEQSMSLVLKDLPRDTSREVFKQFIARPMDVFNYKAIKMFVHGDPTFAPGSSEIYIRFGADQLNFYEYRQPIYPGWNMSKNEINIVFARITAVKSGRPDSIINKYYTVDALNGHDGAKYAIKGNPSLRQIREITIGVKNVNEPYLTGQVWVNELRVVDVDNSPGMSYRFDSQLKLADLGQISFNFTKTDPSFHSLDQRFGNQITGVSWAVNTSVSFDRFFPESWQGTSIPFAYSHSENVVKPKYLTNTDIVVEEAAKKAGPDASQRVLIQSQTLNIKDSYSLSNFRIALPFQAWYVRETISKLTFAFNYNTSRDRDPAYELRKSWAWNLRVNYGTSLPPNYFIQPFSSIFKGIFLLDEFKDWKFYYIPITSISASAGGQRSWSVEAPRAKNSIMRESRNFGANKSFGFGWKFTENGLLNFSGDYGISIDKDLNPYDNDTVGRGFMSIMKTLFFGGRDTRYGQRVSINMRPKIPNILDIPKYFDLSTGYSVNYGWQNTYQKGDIGKSAGYDNNISASLTFRLKSLTDPWFDFKEETPQPPIPPPPIVKPEDSGALKDSTAKKDTSQVAPPRSNGMKNILNQLRMVGKLLIKVPLLDFENINISYTQSNRSANGALLGTNGFKNFWGRLPFQGSLNEYGPSRLFQLGLINDPHGTLKFAPISKFPFLAWKTIPGLRAPKAQMSDQLSQSNNLTLKTNRALWSGASIDINWKVGWQYNRTTTIQTDSLGHQIAGIPQTSGSIDRSYLTLPPVLFFKVFKSNLENVGKKYQQFAKTNPSDVALVKAFEEGFEALPFLSKIIGPYVPRPNWSFRWDGIEKLAGLGSVMERLSLEHNYSSNFRRDFRSDITRKGQLRTDAERMSYGFKPLAGLNMTFKQVLKGNLSGNFQYSTTTNYDLNLTAQQPNITSGLQQEISFSLSYARRGFSFPLFGLSLSNDIDISLTYSRAKNSRRRYDPILLTSDQEGTPLEGNVRTSMEPRIRYVLSTRVTAALYYRYTKTAPDAAGSAIFGVTTNEAGVDIHISI